MLGYLRVVASRQLTYGYIQYREANKEKDVRCVSFERTRTPDCAKH